MKAILLAAGRGSRLGAATRAQPKCHVEVGGRRLLDWQCDALTAAGIDDLVVVRGFARAGLRDPRLRPVDNVDWATTNMVRSLWCARHELHGDVLIAYTDILYGVEMVDRARASSAEIGVVIDRDWLALWRRRMDDPLSDAESLKLDEHGRILEIGQPPQCLDAIEGQYVGMIRLSPAGSDRVRTLLEDLVDRGEPVRDGRTVDDAYATDLLMRLVDDGVTVMSIPIRGGWCEIDAPRDLKVARQLWSEGSLPLVDRGAVACAR